MKVGRYGTWVTHGRAREKRRHRLFRVRRGLLRDAPKASDILERGGSRRPSASNALIALDHLFMNTIHLEASKGMPDY